MSIIIKTEHEITDTALYYQLVTAWEGGSNYWIDNWEYREDPRDKAMVKRVQDAAERSTLEDEDKGFLLPVDGKLHLYAYLMFEPNIVRIMPDDQDEDFIVGRDDLKRGFQVMKDQFPHHWRDFVNGNSDATTADVWFQCVCFGDVVYS